MENNSPLVSVIMNCYNSDKYLKEAIDSVIAQTYQNWEIIFWDNQSTDKSAEIVKSYDNERIKYFYAYEHTTLGEGRNKALEKVNGEFISFLDCDDLLSPLKIELEIKEFLKNDNIGLVYCNGARIDSDSRIKTKFYYNNKPNGKIFRKTLKNYDFYIPSVLIKKSICDKNNIRFNDKYRLIEEYDFFLRILYVTEASYIDQELAYWRVHGGSDTWKNYEKFIIEREDFIESFFVGQMKETFHKEINAIQDLNSFQKALVLWKSGQNKKARHIINHIKFNEIKYFAVYILIFFDYKIIYPLIIKFKYIK